MRSLSHIVCLLGVAWALCCSPQPAYGDGDFGHAREPVKMLSTASMLEKLGRGMSNTLTGWIEIPYTLDTELTTSGTNAVAASTVGLVKGTWFGVRRTAVGLFELLTFWYPIPDDYGPILPEPAYFTH